MIHALLLSSLLGAAPHADTAKARALLVAGDWAAAEKAWAKAPPSGEMWKSIGLARLRLGRASEAVPAFRASLDLAPKDVETKLYLGIAFAQTGKFEEAIWMFSNILRDVPGQKSALLARANTLTWAKRLPEAEVDYRAAAVADPANFDAWFGLAQVLAWQGKLDDAYASFQNAEKLARNHAESSRAVGREGQVRAWQKKSSDAQALYQKAVGLDTANGEAWMGLSEVLEWNGKFKESREAVEKALLANPGDSAARKRLVMLEWVK
jgi:superkiller protein 3